MSLSTLELELDDSDSDAGVTQTFRPNAATHVGLGVSCGGWGGSLSFGAGSQDPSEHTARRTASILYAEVFAGMRL